jgi:hypothetical protein
MEDINEEKKTISTMNPKQISNEKTLRTIGDILVILGWVMLFSVFVVYLVCTINECSNSLPYIIDCFVAFISFLVFGNLLKVIANISISLKQLVDKDNI